MERELVTQDKDTELLPLVDEDGNILGAVSRADAHTPVLINDVTKCPKPLHPVVHLHVFNENGDLYLQHRAEWKKVQPGKWDTATGGHIDLGESVAQALEREVYEEIGLKPEDYEPTLIEKYVYESDIERELVYVYKTTYGGEPQPSETETQGGRFWPMDEIKVNIGKEVFTPMFEQEFQKLFA